MQCLADVILDSDLCLNADNDPLELTSPDNSFRLTLSNHTPDEKFPDGTLSAQLIFDAPSLEGIRELAFERLSTALNCLVYTTNRKFVVRLLKRIIDWTPGVIDRQAIIFVEEPEWNSAEPLLESQYIDTAARLLAMQTDDRQQVAMRWYRRAIQAENMDEQFSCFWFALEIVAQTQKGTQRVESKCPKCKGSLFCESCGDHPTHRRYPGEAIEHTVRKVHSKDADEIFEVLQKIRHTLMHGGEISSVEKELPCTGEEAVNKLAFVTWNAIGLMFGNPDPDPDTAMTFGYVENLVRRRIVGGARITTRMPGDPQNPKLSDFSTFDFSIKTEPHPAGAKRQS